MSRRRHSNVAAGSVSLQIGKPFNPFGLFNGILIPEVLVRAKGISPGAKLAYGRLARYAGQDGDCYPAAPTLAEEIGMSVRQTQYYLGELERNKFIRRITRLSKSGQRSNAFEFLWHPLFEEGVKKGAPEGVQDIAPEGVQNPAPKWGQLEESHSEESQNIDLDSPPTNRKKRDSRLDFDDAAPSCKQYPRLREALADYMTAAGDHERVYPPDRLVVDVMVAAGGATEEEVIQCLEYLLTERGLRPSTRYGPRHFSWFKTVVAEYFQQKCNREMVFAPANVDWAQRNGSGFSQQEFDSMTDAIEVDGSNE
jgi:hypothetical protein